jgi:hypothetical protein
MKKAQYSLDTDLDGNYKMYIANKNGSINKQLSNINLDLQVKNYNE